MKVNTSFIVLLLKTQFFAECLHNVKKNEINLDFSEVIPRVPDFRGLIECRLITLGVLTTEDVSERCLRTFSEGFSREMGKTVVGVGF